MANITFNGKRLIDGVETNVTYLATVQGDGYCYFNDADMFRCYEDGSNLQIFYFTKEIWVNTSVIYDLQPTKFDILEILQKLFSLLGGGGSSAGNAKVENAVKWMVDKATNNYITYSQSNRNLNNPAGLSYDCSSFVITAFNQAGFDINSSYTGDMKSGFTSEGWEWHPVYNGTITADMLVRGDILLNEGKHTQVYIGNNQDVNCGSTPARVMSHINYYSGGGWDGYLHYPQSSNTITVPGNVPQTGIIGDYTPYANISWSSGTPQRRLFNEWRDAGSPYNARIAYYQQRFLVAMRPKFGSVGDKVDIHLANGSIIYAILADEKGEDAGNEWGHYFGNAISLVEFEAESGYSTSDVPNNWRSVHVDYVENQGSIW